METNEVNVGQDNVDPTLLKVLGNKIAEQDVKMYVKKLANAILRVIEKHNIANLRCVGGAALSHADKAIAIAEEIAQAQGVELVEKTKFTDVDFGGDIKTGLLRSVYPLKTTT